MRSFVFALLALFAVSELRAAPSEHPSIAFVRALGDEGLQILGNRSLSKRERREALLALYRRHFDYEYVGRGILGRTILGASPHDVERLKELVARNIAKKVEAKLQPYAGSRLTVVRREENGPLSEITTFVAKIDGTGSIGIVWILKSTDTSHLVRDVKIEGFSLVLNERTLFAEIFRKAELSFTFFIKELERLTAFDD